MEPDCPYPGAQYICEFGQPLGAVRVIVSGGVDSLAGCADCVVEVGEVRGLPELSYWSAVARTESVVAR